MQLHVKAVPNVTEEQERQVVEVDGWAKHRSSSQEICVQCETKSKNQLIFVQFNVFDKCPPILIGDSWESTMLCHFYQPYPQFEPD